jgi:hypothetical protein
MQAANGSCFALVPYVSEHVGSVSGIVGAGGNLGAMCFALMFLFTGYEVPQGLEVWKDCNLASRLGSVTGDEQQVFAAAGCTPPLTRAVRRYLTVCGLCSTSR